jgi:glycine cleavage system H lipoate-binding protein
MDMIGTELFATKGIEYLLVIAYLVLLVACRRMVGPRRARRPVERPEPTPEGLQAFKVRDDLLYHQGHAWAAPAGEGRMRVGMDDFARQLLGPTNGIVPPAVGTRLAEGEPGWAVMVDGKRIPFLSPVDGEVVAWNGEVLRSPERIDGDPYGDGWLFEVKVASVPAAGRNLLSGRLAHAWMDQVADRIDRMVTLPDGLAASGRASGKRGIARSLTPDAWEETVRSFLLVDGEGEAVEEVEEEGADKRTPVSV